MSSKTAHWVNAVAAIFVVALLININNNTYRTSKTLFNMRAEVETRYQGVAKIVYKEFPNETFVMTTEFYNTESACRKMLYNEYPMDTTTMISVYYEVVPDYE